MWRTPLLGIAAARLGITPTDMKDEFKEGRRQGYDRGFDEDCCNSVGRRGPVPQAASMQLCIVAHEIGVHEWLGIASRSPVISGTLHPPMPEASASAPLPPLDQHQRGMGWRCLHPRPGGKPWSIIEGFPIWFRHHRLHASLRLVMCR